MFTGDFILINNDGDPTKPKYKFKKGMMKRVYMHCLFTWLGVSVPPLHLTVENIHDLTHGG